MSGWGILMYIPPELLQRIFIQISSAVDGYAVVSFHLLSIAHFEDFLIQTCLNRNSTHGASLALNTQFFSKRSATL